MSKKITLGVTLHLPFVDGRKRYALFSLVRCLYHCKTELVLQKRITTNVDELTLTEEEQSDVVNQIHTTQLSRFS